MSDILSLKNKLDNHFDVLLDSLKKCSNEEPDILIITDEGNKIFTQRLLLCLHSPMVSGVLAGVPSSVQSAMSLPVSAKALLNLLKVLTTGVVVSEASQDLVDVQEAAKMFGMDFDNFQIGVKRKKTIPNLDELRPAIVAATNVGHTDVAQEHSNVSTINCENIKEETTNRNEEVKIKDGNKLESKTCECGKSFSTNEKLSRHALTHTGVKPFECEHCAKAFSRKDKLNEHVKKIHV
eukprot:GFUD01038633.1.p1 GENE.GFUD01038633.1~~GFUD01038633.1.p1  ORF type:complete len:237 (-),score=63.12 GFUD01038633.1:3-713(-)